jgi:hypothetical protein
MKLVLKAGALIAIDPKDTRLGPVLDAAAREDVAIVTSGAVVAQVWRTWPRQANLARTLAGVGIYPLEAAAGRNVGELPVRNGTGDVVDGDVALLTEQGHTIATSDVAHSAALLRAKQAKAIVRHV